MQYFNLKETEIPLVESHEVELHGAAGGVCVEQQGGGVWFRNTAAHNRVRESRMDMNKRGTLGR